ncbi:patatin-like phospholipase family protein [Dysosmobacter acutus]|uniref:patatin-like phospholipase family protein n=1 Tax=Dysosmobacter acutus TaxID=2841504 RepID=UPI001F4CBD49|nr:patatin family protein [Dysosmobacter acutus]
MNENSALILEGGSLRCQFTAGVLDVFMEKGILFPCVAGVSAGALCGINYLSGQIGRTAKINLEFANDKRYMGLGNLVRRHSVFNFDFLFGEVSDTLVPLDRKAFEESAQRFAAVSTDVRTGEMAVHEKGVSEDILLAARASASLPLLAPIVEVDGKRCLDGGVAMPIPVEWALQEGYEKIVLVLTRQKGYRKRPVRRAARMAYERMYRDYPMLLWRLNQVPVHYNELQVKINRLERAGRVFVIRPRDPVMVSRVERDTEKLKALYEIGRESALRRMDEMKAYLDRP